MSKETVLLTLFDRHFREVYDSVNSLVNDAVATEDITAGAFMALYRKLDGELWDEERVRSFLSTKARCLCLRYLKIMSNEPRKI